MALLFDVIADLPEGITVMPVFAADKPSPSRLLRSCSQAIG